MKPPLTREEPKMKPTTPAAATPRAKSVFVLGMLVLAIGVFATPMLTTSAGNAQAAALKDETAKLGAPKIEGSDTVGGKDAPACISARPK
jgi:hypothetical protein